MSFESIIGHEEIKKQLINSINMGAVTHAHIFSGEDGIGKSLIAEELAIHIIGKEKQREYVDISHYRPSNGKLSIGIKDILDIIEEVNKKPYEGDKKVLIIHEANKMTVEAQNAFLKTIEEPPKGVFIILLTENLQDILDTIKSRCQIHKLRRLSQGEMTSLLKRDYPGLNESQLKNILSFSDGIPKRAEMLINDKDYENMRQTVIEIIINSGTNRGSEVFSSEEFLCKSKLIWREMLTVFLSYIRDALVYKETGKEELIINIDKLSGVKQISDIFSFKRLTGMVDIINYTAENLERNVNTALTFDAMLLKFQEG